MKSLLAILSLTLMMFACEKPNKTPEGPTDVRVWNITDQDFTNLSVDTGGGDYDYGNLSAGEKTDYYRFEKAYPDAEITVTINGEEYSTGPQDYTYATYIGPDMVTYKVYISNPELKILGVDIVLEGPIEE